MKEVDRSYSSLPDDIALKIASSLQVADLCALASCSRFWRQLCASDHIWETLVRTRWPLSAPFIGGCCLAFPSQYREAERNSRKWRYLYIKQHCERAEKAMSVVKSVALRCASDSLIVEDYLKVIQGMWSMGLEFKDVEMFLFKPNLSVLVNLIGLHYCLLLKVPAKDVLDTLQSLKISERLVFVKWWTLGRWLYGFRMRDESRSRLVSLMELLEAEEHEVLNVLTRGAVHEVLCVRISPGKSYFTPATTS